MLQRHHSNGPGPGCVSSMTDTATRPERRPSTLALERQVRSWPVVLALLTVLAGLVAGAAYLTPQPPGEDSAAVGFARDMSQHHAQAVAMSETIRDRATDPAVRGLAADVALTQQGQIGIMSGWLELWGQTTSGSGPRMAWMGAPTEGLMPGMATRADVQALATLPVAQAEARYLQLMVAHHTGGVEMAQAGVQLGGQPQVVQLAGSIAASQASEIDYLQSLLSARGLPPAPAPQLVDGQHGDAGAEGHSGSGGPAARDVVLLTIVSLAVVALLWLLIDTPARQLGIPLSTLRPVVLLLAAAAATSAAVHLVLTPGHAREGAGYGAFFVLSALVLAAATAVLMAGFHRTGALVAGVASGVLVLTYGVFRIVPPPGADVVEGIDGWGIFTVTAELVVLGCAAIVLLRRDHDPRAAYVG